ncbi:PIG-L family deacetylase [Deinococcus koreensis]|uniref:PIG-L family deacetylase n=1 Tax=Deinococcus koreensis TaxID=2054903 RepID=A0A2K3USS6_9DEIO|nr:PIG-L family deacetylase [Deinococcus koreensis]
MKLLDPRTLPGPVWVVSPHPDDEALGCGALIAALTTLGQDVWALLVSDGAASHPGSRAFPPSRLSALRLSEWRAGLAELGVPPEHTQTLNLPDGALDRCDPAVIRPRLQAAFAGAPPRTLLLPWRRDPHPDHRACWTLLMAARPAGCRVLGYSVWLTERGTPDDWPPADEARPWAFEIGGAAARKSRAISAHASQLGLIQDDPGGFTLAEAMVARAVRGPERLFEPLESGGTAESLSRQDGAP